MDPGIGKPLEELSPRQLRELELDGPVSLTLRARDLLVLIEGLDLVRATDDRVLKLVPAAREGIARLRRRLVDFLPLSLHAEAQEP